MLIYIRYSISSITWHFEELWAILNGDFPPFTKAIRKKPSNLNNEFW